MCPSFWTEEFLKSFWFNNLWYVYITSHFMITHYWGNLLLTICHKSAKIKRHYNFIHFPLGQLDTIEDHRRPKNWHLRCLDRTGQANERNRFGVLFYFTMSAANSFKTKLFRNRIIIENNIIVSMGISRLFLPKNNTIKHWF